MKKYSKILLLVSLVITLLVAGCKKKEKPMVDINSIRSDGSHDDRYIFREEIEKEKRAEEKSRKSDPDFK